MKIAVLQHRLRDRTSDDVTALVDAAKSAAQHGARFIVFPHLRAFAKPEFHTALHRELAQVPAGCLVPQAEDGCGFELIPGSLPGVEELGSGALLVGDAAMDIARWSDALAAQPAFVVMNPDSENELQAEAALELAISVSDSVAGLVMVAECDGAELGAAGHGGSAIVFLGDLVAEALGGEDVLFAEIPTPIPQPEPREPLPEVPTLLQQRLANHQGRHLDMGYLADLSS